MLEKVSGWFDANADVVKGWGDALYSIGDKVSSFVANKVTNIMEAVKSMTQSPEWQDAEGLWGKIKVAWDKQIAEPFDKWWNGKGKTWLSEKMNSVGAGIGSAIKGGINAILGIDADGALSEGASIGKSFVDGFLEGFDGAKIGEAIKKIVSDAFKLAYSNPVTGTLATAFIGSKVLGGANAVYKGVKGVKGAVSGAKGIWSAITGASKVAGGAAEAANVAGAASTAAKVASVGAKGASVAGKAIPLIGGLISLAEMGVDAYHGVGKSEEWLGDNSMGNKVAAGAGAFLGGTGGGIMGDGSGWDKAKEIGGGALKGAGLGAGIGTLVMPGIGTAIGGAIGAVVGGVGAAIGGENISKALSTSGKGIATFFTSTIPSFFKTLWGGISGFFTETIPNTLSTVGNAVRSFFTETIPAKFGELIDSIKSFFGETVPYAIGFVVGSVVTFITQTVPAAVAKVGEALKVFFTETVPAFFTNLWDGAVGFFTETIPAALEMVSAALGTFFTETVPNFFAGLWDGAVEFFTEKVPEALETVGTALGTFFTETVPNFFTQLWDGAVGFFTETIPNAINSVKEGISSFFSRAKDKITGFFSGIWDGITSFFGGAADSFSAGYSDATKHASGGIMTSPHFGLVAEDGAEAIIPLSGKRRGRGLALWEQTGELLGVKPYAEGGIAGVATGATDNAEAPQPIIPAGKENGDGYGSIPPITITNTIGDMVFHIENDGNTSTDDIVRVISENIDVFTNRISYNIARGLEQTFANLPIAAYAN
ncbi:hypothetical protein FACS189425_05180 [Clostridia bacterium]|nr:hypothetical protein FACS189425_05180 [Clostridia bacterium]